MGDRIKLRVILGSTRQGRLGDKLAKWIHDLAKERGDLDVELLDLRDYPLPFLGEEARSASEPADKLIAAWATKVSEADGFIIATAEYNHGYPAVLKNALDSIKNEWSNKPVAFVSWGGVSGGARAVEQLRQVVVELQMVPIRNAVHIPFVWNLMDDDGSLKPEALNVHQEGAKNLLDQLVWWAKILKTARV